MKERHLRSTADKCNSIRLAVGQFAVNRKVSMHVISDPRRASSNIGFTQHCCLLRYVLHIAKQTEHISTSLQDATEASEVRVTNVPSLL